MSRKSTLVAIAQTDTKARMRWRSQCHPIGHQDLDKSSDFSAVFREKLAWKNPTLG
ncbi:hypothetical protein ACQ4M4_06640 [Leptolyngbya sp. AN02str]